MPALGVECSRSELGHPFVIMLMHRFGKMIAAIDLLDDGGQKASNKNIDCCMPLSIVWFWKLTLRRSLSGFGRGEQLSCPPEFS